MFDFLKTKKQDEEELTVVFDVGSSSVGVMAVRTGRGGGPASPKSQRDEGGLDIISAHRIRANFLWEVDFEAFWRVTKKAFETAAKRLLRERAGKVDKFAVVFSSPWFVSRAKNIAVRKEEPFFITVDFFEKIINEEKKYFEERQEHEQKQALPGDLRVIECQFIKTKLNGYQSNSPLGKKVKSFDGQLYMSLGVRKVMREIGDIISLHFHSARVEFQTFPLVLFKVMKTIMNAGDGFILVDVGGEITDISVVRENTIEEMASFPKGKNVLLRETLKEFNTFPKEASSIIAAYSNGHLEGGQKERMAKVMEKSKEEWCSYLKKAVDLVRNSSPLPQKMFLVGGDGIGKWFASCVHDEYFSKFTALGQPISLEVVRPSALSHYFNFKTPSRGGHDAFLMIESLYASQPNKK